MTRVTVAVTTYRAAVICDRCGLRLYAYERPGLDGWLRGRGWVVDGERDVCPGCAEVAKEERIRD